MRRDRLTAMLALAAGVGAVLLVLGSDRERSPAAASAALALVVGWAYIGSGLIARRQRPENRLGTVMVFIGFAWFATFLADAGSSLVFTLGTAVESVYLLGFVYLVLSFPTGRLRSTLDGALIAAAIAIVTVVELAWLLFADSHSQICSQCPRNAFEVARNDGVARPSRRRRPRAFAHRQRCRSLARDDVPASPKFVIVLESRRARHAAMQPQTFLAFGLACSSLLQETLCGARRDMPPRGVPRAPTLLG
jgi:peptidoglycan/LPS O-acetylase OafA/YrhL